MTPDVCGLLQEYGVYDLSREVEQAILSWWSAGSSVEVIVWNICPSYFTLEQLKTLHRNGFGTPTSRTIDSMPGSDCHGLESIEWLHSLGLHGTADAVEYAAQNGQIDVLQYLHKMGYRMTSDALEYAREENQHDVVKWLESMMS